MIISLIMFSYDSKDPSFRSSTNQDINNLLGSFGSNIADPVHLSLGMSYLVIILILFVWSWRLVFNVSREKILSRVFFIPIPIVYLWIIKMEMNCSISKKLKII